MNNKKFNFRNEQLKRKELLIPFNDGTYVICNKKDMNPKHLSGITTHFKKDMYIIKKLRKVNYKGLI